MERLALPPGRKYETQVVVNSANLIGYLGHNEYYDLPGIRFASDLDLKWCTRFIRQVDRAQKIQDFTQAETLREQAATFQEHDARRKEKNYLPTTKLFFEVLRHLDQYDPIDPFQKDIVERYKLAYWDFQKKSVRATRIKYGKYESVGGAIEALCSVAEAGNMPLIDIHSHPRLALFSPNDHREVITLNPWTRQPSSVLKGTIVVCPEEQILALATPQTPRVQWIDAVSWVDSSNRELDEKDKYVNGKSEDTLKKWIQRFANKVTALHGEYSEFEKMLNDSDLPEDQWRATYKRNHDKTKAFLLESLVIYLGIAKGQNQILSEGRSWLTNEHLQGVYRELNLKMYRSTDMRHFKEFSA